ncbi:Protein of unknown function [Bacillus cereus]|nr:Protein of unknown function [Bacillus cereus]
MDFTRFTIVSFLTRAGLKGAQKKE